MKIDLIVFAYSFPHKKTFDGLSRILAAGFRPSLVWAADKVELGIPRPTISLSASEQQFPSAKTFCLNNGIHYYNAPHDPSFIPPGISNSPKRGIILGARILKQELIDWCQEGVINLHPGILPSNRGLDNIKWAILDEIPQGVTIHFIDAKIDRGLLIDRAIINLNEQDSLRDINTKVTEKEMELLTNFLETPPKRKINFTEILGLGRYHSWMPRQLEQSVLVKFPHYVKNYSRIVDSFAKFIH